MAQKQVAEISVWIGGAAGDGIASAGESFAKACMRDGYQLFAYNSYQSVIRGGHVCMHMRVGREPVLSHGDVCHALMALNLDTMLRYGKRVQPGGAVLFNTDKIKASPEMFGEGVQACGLPVMELVKNPIMQNTVALGSLMWLFQLDPAPLKELIKSRFAKKGDDVVATNLEAFEQGKRYAETHFTAIPMRLVPPTQKKRRLLLSGNEAIGFGAVAAGCRFYSAYPMTPASSLLHYLVQRAAKTGILVKQVEDEIAALNMAIGAAHVGVRAMTGTSGGGFSLMTEAVGEAGMTETPVVIVEAQRGGPSTGLPTKTEQADLFQMLGASQGEFPKVILAPRTVEECFYVTQEAFNLAERYQCPVIIATDLYLAEHLETIDGLELDRIPIDRGEAVVTWSEGDGYLRYKDTPSGVSPRVVPGTPGAPYVAATDEHDEEGIVISDVFTNPPKRVQMMEKRMRKLNGILKELPPPELEGPKNAVLTLVGWGSTTQVLREIQRQLTADGTPVNLLAIRNLWPFQGEAVAALLQSARMTLAVEANYTGQLSRLIRMETGLAIQHHLRKYDGEPFEPGQILTYVKRLLQERPTPPTVGSVVSDEGLPKDFSPTQEVVRHG